MTKVILREEDEDALGLDELVNRVIAWGEMHGITNIWSQASKVTEEWGETIGEMNHNRFGANFEDGIGDTLVSLIIFAHINGKDIAKCLADSLRTIQDRDGETIDGNFIKKGEK